MLPVSPWVVRKMKCVHDNVAWAVMLWYYGQHGEMGKAPSLYFSNRSMAEPAAWTLPEHPRVMQKLSSQRKLGEKSALSEVLLQICVSAWPEPP